MNPDTNTAPAITAPYPGLRPFERHENILFFGREEQVDQLLDKLGESHFLAVLGLSGSGKSSLVRAGLLPALEGGALVGAGARWQVAELRPGDGPVARLARALRAHTPWGQAGPDGPDALEEKLRRGSQALNWLLGVRPLASGHRLLILVDQFEELFRFHNQGEAAAFVALLLAAAGHPDVYIIITMRSEFLGACGDYPDLAEAINAGLFLTPALAPEQLLDAIEFPIRLPGFAKEGQQAEVEQELARALLADAQGIVDPLPLLQHALLRLWNAHEKDGGDGVLTLARYRELGGLQQALNDHLDAAFDELDSEHRRIAEVMFRALTEHGGGLGHDLDDGGRDTRRPARVGDIALLAGVEPEAVAAAARPFRQEGRSFLMPPVGQGLGTDTVLDITHEALIRQWRRLKVWTADEGEQADLYRRLTGDARRHAAGEAALWIDPALRIALDWREENAPGPAWAARYGGGFDQAMGFLEESRAARAAHQAEEEARGKRELERARRVALGAVLGLLVAMGLALWAVVERFNAEEAEQIAEKSEEIRTRALFDSALTHAALLARVEDPMEGRRVLAETLILDADIPPQRRHARNLLAGYLDLQGGTADKIYDGAGAQLIDLALSPDGRTLVAAGERDTLVLFDVESGQIKKKLEGHETPPTVGASGEGVRAVSFSRDGRILYSGGADGRILRWSLPEGERVGEPWQAPAAVFTLALSPDGKVLASAGRGDGITLWSTGDGKAAGTTAVGGVAGVEGSEPPESPDHDTPTGVPQETKPTPLGATLRADPSHPLLATLRGKTSLISDGNALAFTPDGRLVSGGFKGDVGIWTLSGDSEPREQVLPRIHTDAVSAIATDPTGQWIATGSGNHIVLWRLTPAGADPIRMLRGHTNRIMGLRFVPGHGQGDKGSRRLLSASHDNTLRLWDLESGAVLRIFQGHTAGLWSVVSDGAPNGTHRHVYTAANDGTIRRWPLATPNQWLWDMPGEPISAAIDPAGRLVSVGFRDGALRFYPLPAAVGWGEERTPTPGSENRIGVRPVPSDLPEFDVGVRFAHPNLPKPMAVVEGAHGSGRIMRIAFHPDGTYLATAHVDAKVKLWRMETSLDGPAEKPVPRHTLDGHGATVHAVAFSPDGRRLATAGYDGKVGLYDTETGEGELFKAHKGRVTSVDFNATGERLLSAGSDEYRIRLWDITQSPPTPAAPPLQSRDAILWATLRPDARQLAVVGRELVVTLHDLNLGTESAMTDDSARRLVGHEQAVYRAEYTPDGTQLATVGGDMTLRLWDLGGDGNKSLFTLRLPTEMYVHGGPSMWDFALRCLPAAEGLVGAAGAANTHPDAGHCWLAVPLTMGRLALYRLPYAAPPAR
uniref:WD40 repeat n=1 Tax=Candidatus Kentrum sp. FW TaxID=2126338 RepID=A0A450TWR5_9GAMM|nr:MAG: WD40 repeat [Candidatus Kentron sp. FW]